MKAKLLLHTKRQDGQGNVAEVVIWKLPKATPDRPHAIKYRLYFGDAKGRCLVRYDNESGKGDHKHIGQKEIAYKFKNIEKLMRDFIKDINELIGKS